MRTEVGFHWRRFREDLHLSLKGKAKKIKNKIKNKIKCMFKSLKTNQGIVDIHPDLGALGSFLSLPYAVRCIAYHSSHDRKFVYGFSSTTAMSRRVSAS